MKQRKTQEASYVSVHSSPSEFQKSGYMPYIEEFRKTTATLQDITESVIISAEGCLYVNEDQLRQEKGDL